MKYLLILSCLLFTSVGWSKDVIFFNLIERNQLYYEKYKDIPFTGNVTGKIQGKISKGLKNGTWKIYYQNGQLSYKVIYKYGKKEGKYLRFWRNGKAMAKGNYKNDKQEGEYLSYYKNGQLWAKDIYKNGQLIETIKP